MSKYILKCISWTVSTCGSWSPARRTAATASSACRSANGASWCGATDMTCIAAIAEKTDFNPREVRGKRYLCAQLHRDIRGPAGTTFPYHKRADGQLWPFSKQDCYVYHTRELSMQECMLRSDAASHTLPVLPLRVVPQSDFIIARCKSILCTRSFPMGYR